VFARCIHRTSHKASELLNFAGWWRRQDHSCPCQAADIVPSAFMSFTLEGPRAEMLTCRRDMWDLGRCGLPGKAAFTASRLAWALRQKSLDAREGSGKLLDRLTGSVDEGDGGQIYGCAAGTVALPSRPACLQMHIQEEHVRDFG